MTAPFPAADDLFESAPAALCLVDASATVRRANRAWLTQCAAAATGTSLPRVFTGLDAAWRHLQEARVPVRAEVHLGAGEKRTLILALNPLEDPADGLVAIAQATDLTALRAAEATARAIMETAVDAMITIDERGVIQSVNAAAAHLLGYGRDEAVGQRVNMLMPEPYRSHHQQYIDRYLHTGKKRIIGTGRELEAVRKDGTRVPVYLAVREFVVGGERHFAGVLHDISANLEARQLRDRLARAAGLGALVETTAAIAHEINQPLTAAAAYAQAARGLLPEESPRQLADALDKVVEQALRAGAVIDRVQHLVRGRGPDRQWRLTDIDAEMRAVVDLARVDAHRHGIRIDLRVPGDLPKVRCDPVQIQQVGFNLIHNAVDAMASHAGRRGHLIRVDIGRLDDADAICVAVVDQGPGVTEGAWDKVFAPFHSGKDGGMGLGLSICRTIVDNHGGRLDFRNNANGVGATFQFTLPVRAEGGEHDD